MHYWEGACIVGFSVKAVGSNYHESYRLGMSVSAQETAQPILRSSRLGDAL